MLQKQTSPLSSAAHARTVGVFSLTLFLSAALMFGLQPMIGKMLLPLVGGTPAGWIVAMAFFQFMLLVGYFLAHVLARFSPVRHALLFILLLAAGIVFLPPRLPAALNIDGAPGALDIFLLLGMTVALPFVAMSATSSTLQRLFTTTSHGRASDPYFLYAASNLGSFAGLLLYPFVAEPLLPLSLQSQGWMYAYLLLIVCAVACLLHAGKTGAVQPAAVENPATPAPPFTPPLAPWTRTKWMLLAFVPSSLLLGVTTHITTDIFSAPLMWVLPLALYLLTFVVAFGRREIISLHAAAALQPIAVTVTIGVMFLCRATPAMVSWYAVFLHLAAFGVVALMCHLYLAKLRPVAHPQHLTTFYLMLAVGGALGGMLNAFIVPVILDSLVEYPAILLLSLLANPRLYSKPLGTPLKKMIGLAIVLIVAVGIVDMQPASQTQKYDQLILVLTGIIVCGAVFLSVNPRAAFFSGLAMLLVSQFLIPQNIIFQDRNFYGHIRVADSGTKINGTRYTERVVRHGSTKHGSQILQSPFREKMTTYYTTNSPPSEFIGMYNPKNIAVVGLGAGTLNCYSTPQNAFTFIDIDASMVEVAQKYFTYLEQCKASRPPRLIVGDGRLELTRMKGEIFDLILLDAFSSDAIPVHLLTTDAIRAYLDRMSPEGIIAFHVSNRYFNLVPVLAKNADMLGLQAYAKLRVPPSFSLESASLWVVMARRDMNLVALMDMGWLAVPAEKDVKPWTDDDNNLMSALILLNHDKKNYQSFQ